MVMRASSKLATIYAKNNVNTGAAHAHMAFLVDGCTVLCIK
jgi:hypothetical protein